MEEEDTEASAGSAEALTPISSETITPDRTGSFLQAATPAPMDIETVIAVGGGAKPEQQLAAGRTNSQHNVHSKNHAHCTMTRAN